MDIPGLSSGAALGLLFTEAGKKLVGPAADTAGQALAIPVDILKFYLGANLESIFTKWGQARKHLETPEVSADECKRVLPLLSLAATASDEDMQTRWAALLQSTSSADPKVLPSFGSTLAQLSPEGVRFLDRLFDMIITDDLRSSTKYSPGRAPFYYHTLISAYDKTINTGVNYAEVKTKSDANRLTDDELNNWSRLEQAQLLVQEFVRQGLLIAETNGALVAPGITRDPWNGTLETKYALTTYAVAFLEACRNKPQND